MIFWGLAAYLVAVNAATAAHFAVDKHRARTGGQRVPEADLLGLAAAGGTPGAFLSIEVFRHKTKKQPFRSRLWTIAGLQGAALAVLCTPPARDALLALFGG